MIPLILVPATVPSVLAYTPPSEVRALESSAATAIPDVPFYSQFRDISSAKWQGVSCGVTSLAMVVNYYDTNATSADTLLTKGIDAGAYLNNVGWTYKGLIGLSQEYGLDGESYDLGNLNKDAAFAQFEKYLAGGPVIASVHYEFDPKSTIPHLVVINGIAGDTLYYNDPAATGGGKEISIADFLKGWKKRFIVIRPDSVNTKRTQLPATPKLTTTPAPLASINMPAATLAVALPTSSSITAKRDVPVIEFLKGLIIKNILLAVWYVKDGGKGYWG